MTASESKLVEQAKRDPEAFAELYRRYVQPIYNYIFHRTGNEEDAEDLTANTFYQALVHIGRYKDRGAPFSAWLYRIAHNLVANWHRDQNRRRMLRLDGLPLRERIRQSPDQMAERRDEEEALMEAVRRLPADRQMLLILKFSEGLSNAQIGEIMGRSEGAIKSLYHRTLVALRADLEAQGYTIPGMGQALGGQGDDQDRDRQHL